MTFPLAYGFGDVAIGDPLTDPAGTADELDPGASLPDVFSVQAQPESTNLEAR